MIEDIVQLRDVETGDCIGELRGVGYFGGMMLWSSQGDQIAMDRLGKPPMALWRIKNNKQGDDKNQAGNENDIDYGDDEDDGSNGCSSVVYTDLDFRLAAFSPNGSQIAGTRSRHSREDYKVYLYDTVTGGQLWASKGHTQEITSIVYSSRGDLIVCASEDQTVRLWDTVSGQCRAVIQDFQHKVRDIAWLETLNAKYVVAGCGDGVVGMWQVIVDEDQCQVRLHWKTTNGMFDVQDASIQGVKGLDSANKSILKQSRAVGEPAHRLREGSKKKAIMAPVVSRLNDPSDWTEEIHNDLINLPAKRLFELDEEDEGATKRTCGNDRVSSSEERRAKSEE
jgi:WD40 repeat protein